MSEIDFASQKSNQIRIIKRKFLKLIGRMFTRIFFQFDLIGKENFPLNGPYIMAGNHVGSIEALLMVCFAPELIEVLGAGDIPLDPKLAYFADLYGYIPINRGEIDQKGLKSALGVLERRGVIGIFPEGGIWDQKIKPAKIGVSWLSRKSNSPIIPIGFVGIKDALKRSIHLKFPHLQMVVGLPIYPDQFKFVEKSQKENLMEASYFIMKQIEALLPETERNAVSFLTDKKTILKIIKVDQMNGDESEIRFQDQDSLSILLQHPVIMDVFHRNLKLPVKPLLLRNKNNSIQEIIIGVKAILQYLDDKPGFLPYRFGFDQSTNMKNGLKSFFTVLREISNDKFSIRFEII
jgi:1-acyl-sn-glycerol-3-phosphate acyltransferase